MNVAVDQDLLVFNVGDPVHEGLRVVDLGVELSTRQNPLPIEVHAGQGTPVVAADHSVRVHAGHKLNDEIGQHRR